MKPRKIRSELQRIKVGNDTQRGDMKQNLEWMFTKTNHSDKGLPEPRIQSEVYHERKCRLRDRPNEVFLDPA